MYALDEWWGSGVAEWSPQLGGGDWGTPPHTPPGLSSTSTPWMTVGPGGVAYQEQQPTTTWTPQWPQQPQQQQQQQQYPQYPLWSVARQISSVTPTKNSFAALDRNILNQDGQQAKLEVKLGDFITTKVEKPRRGNRTIAGTISVLTPATRNSALKTPTSNIPPPRPLYLTIYRVGGG